MLKKLALLLIFTLLLTGCTAAPQNSGSYTFTDDTGVTLSLEPRPQRVAVLFSSFAEVWTLAGGKVDVTVGESVERGFADESAILVDSGAGKTINTELLLQSEPDLVLCSADIAAQVEAAALLNQSGIPAACFRVDTFEDYLRMLKICTDLAGDSAAYEENGAAVAARIAAMLSGLDGEPQNKQILFIRAGSGASSTKAKTAAENFVCAMLKELGTENIAEAAPILLDGLSMEAILAQPAWQSLRAVQEGNYVYLPKDLFQFKPNARWDEAYAYLIDLIYEN